MNLPPPPPPPPELTTLPVALRPLPAWATSKRRISIVFLNAVLAVATVLSTLLLWEGTQTIQTCLRFQCLPSITSARLPTNFSERDLLITSRHSGYTVSNNRLRKVFSTGNLFLIPPFFTYSSDGLGFRKHRTNSVESSKLLTKVNVLALGDSFTYGSKVSDLATWPAYLERANDQTVHNAGVGWFGSAQAVARGYDISLTMHIDTVILSVLVDEDIKRDRWITHGQHGQYRRRPVVDRNGVLMHLPAYDSKAGLGGLWYGIIQAGAASMDSIMDYVLQRLLQIPADKHILLLQYGDTKSYHDSSKEMREIREEQALWTKKAEALNIPLVDTFDPLKKAEDSRSPLWIQNTHIPPSIGGHHTSYGNEIVAQAILDSGVLD